MRPWPGTPQSAPFEPFEVHPTSVAVYHLGESGAAPGVLG